MRRSDPMTSVQLSKGRFVVTIDYVAATQSMKS